MVATNKASLSGPIPYQPLEFSGSLVQFGQAIFRN
jgi:hypothetical protein